MIKKLFLFFALIFLLLFVSACSMQKSPRILEQAVVIRIIDGDTIKVDINGTVETIRLLHINTPEKNEKCYDEATLKLKELIEDKTVWLERDMQSYDLYNRSLRYIFLIPNTDKEDYDSFVNLMMVQEGYASSYILIPNTKYKNEFIKAEENATQNRKGCLWQNISQYFGCILIDRFIYDAEGDDCENPNAEYVILKNICEDINVNNWIIKDEGRNRYVFDSVIFKNNSTLTLHSGSGSDDKSRLIFFWNNTGRCLSIWNNDHDTFFMNDENGNLVLKYNY